MLQTVQIVFITLLFNSFAQAQSSTVIRPDRPSQSISPYVVGAGVFQMESGWQQSREKNDIQHDVNLISNQLRYGVSENFEINAMFDWQRDTFSHSPMNNHEGISAVRPGFRFNIFSESKGWRPALAVQTRFQLTTVSSIYRSKNLAPLVIVTTQNDLGKGMSLSTNGLVIYNGNSSIPKYGYTANFGFPIADNLNGFAEIYGYLENSYGTTYGDIGLAYLLTKSFQLDLYGGWGHNRGVTQSFISFGVSWNYQNHNHSSR
ncbi:MAG: transporter [Bdellovibrionaceae bacterium]|nr:transporter [Pseudobdellovibrionaceae bacterium]